MKIPSAVGAILCTLEGRGYAAWCVGGCVRDALLGRTPDDWDVTTSALPEETMALFGPAAIPTGLKHGTVTVLSENTRVEVTTFRTDGTYRDHRHPDAVRFTPSLSEDLSRRDFTVNAMALNLAGELSDPFHGQADLASRRLACVGDPMRRFSEDALRILRCLRFSSVLGFSIEAETARSLRESRALLSDIAPERVRGELTKLLCGPGAADVLRAFPEVIGVVMPEILPMIGFDQHSRYHCFDVWEHTLHALAASPEEPILRWAVLLHDAGKPLCHTQDDRGGHFYGHPAISRRIADGLLRRLRFDNAARAAILSLVEWHDRPIPPTERGVRRALMQLGEERLRQLLLVKRADNLGQAAAYRSRQKELSQGEAILNALLEKDACFSLKKLAVDGRDLLALGLSGPEVGCALRALLTAVVDGSLPNEREALLSAVTRRAL